MNRPMGLLLSVALLAVTASPAAAESIAGVEFPDGVRSFADAVVDYSAPADQPTEPHRHPVASIGAPDFDRDDFDTYVSLGQGGSVTLRFSDNSLTGSGDSAPDLWIFESGDVLEDTFVEISNNGRDWVFVGEVTGATSGIDIDALGFGPGDLFSFVRLTDDPSEGGAGATAGADIDAVGAIASGAVVADPEAEDAQAGSTSPFSGAWLTDAGDQVVIFETEDGLGGSSDARNGRYLLSAADEILTLEGYWFEEGMPEECETPRDGQDRWGRLTLRLSEDLLMMTAESSVCDTDPAGQESWTAMRITPTIAADAGPVPDSAQDSRSLD